LRLDFWERGQSEQHTSDKYEYKCKNPQGSDVFPVGQLASVKNPSPETYLDL